VSTARVKITKADKFQAKSQIAPVEHLLHSKFGLTIGIDWELQVVNINGIFDGISKKRRCGRKNKVLGLVLLHGLKKINSSTNIVIKVFQRIGHAFASFNGSAKVLF
jgi:hypothetical protein